MALKQHHEEISNGPEILIFSAEVRLWCRTWAKKRMVGG